MVMMNVITSVVGQQAKLTGLANRFRLLFLRHWPPLQFWTLQILTVFPMLPEGNIGNYWLRVTT